MPADFEISPLITPPASRPPSASVPVQPVPPPTSVPPLISPIMTKKSSQMLRWLILVAAGLIVVTIGALWWGGNSFSDKGVILTLEAPDHATSGDEITYKITYRNDTRVPLSAMSFRLFYPEGSLVLKDGQPAMPESEGFVIDKLDPGQSGTKELQIFMVGDKGAIRTARLNLIFNAGTLKSSFQKETTAATTITALPVTLTLVAPPTTVTSQPIQYLLDMRNDSGQNLADLKLVLKYPDGFVVQKMNPSPSMGNTVWNFDTLGTTGGKRITVDGVLQGNEGETKTVTAVLQRNLNGQYVDYVRTEAFTMLSSPLLSVTISPEGGRDFVTFPGDALRYTITYTNNSRFTLLGLMLGVKLEGDMYDVSRLQTQQGFFDDVTRILAYDSAGVPDFSALTPGRTGRLTFSIPLKAGLSGSTIGGSSSFFVKATARLSTSQVPSGIDGTEVFALDSVITKIGSQPTLTQAALYDNGAGSGPVPPIVGSETLYTLRWQLTNPGNDVRDAKVTATLPPGVTYKDAPTATNGTPPMYDRTRSTVTWVVGTLPFGTGNGTPRYEATFKISIKPSSPQQHTTIKLISGSALSGTDGFTGQAVQSKPRDLTTNDVEGHLNEGVVQ